MPRTHHDISITLPDTAWTKEEYGRRLGPIVYINGAGFHTRAVPICIRENGEQAATSPEGRAILHALYQIDDGGLRHHHHPRYRARPVPSPLLVLNAEPNA